MESGADRMPLPSNRDREDIRRRLGAWLAGRLPAGAAPSVSALAIPETNGLSSETLLFEARWQEGGTPRGGRFVARMSPQASDFPVFPRYDLELQYRCLDLVGRHTGVPVPRTPWLELDDGPLGAPFFVMEHVDGVVPSDMPPYVFGGWLAEASAADRARLERGALEILAKLHALDLRTVDASFLDRPEHGRTPLAQHLGYQRWYYDWARRGERYPIIERTFDWLEAHRPTAEGPAVLNWGDARIGNILFRDFEPVAVLDWEMAALGAPEVDLGWMLVMHRFFADLAQQMGLPGIPGFLDRTEAVATYEELAGRRVRDLEFYEVFAAQRWAIISIRAIGRRVVLGEIPAPATPEGIVMHAGMMERMLSGAYWA
jgi:aminoglycoside phosphotransferase (APT) family kinase protein